MPNFKLYNDNTAICWQIKEEKADIMDPEHVIFRRLEIDALEEYYASLGFTKEKEAVNDIEGIAATNDSFKSIAWDLAMHFATNKQKVFAELYEAFQKGYGVEVNPLIAELILAVGVGFKNKKAVKLAEEVGLEIDKDMKVSVLAIEILIGDIGNNLPYNATQADSIACLIKVDQVMQEELAEITGDQNVRSLISHLSTDPMWTYVSDYNDYLEITSNEVHTFRDTGLLGNASPLKSLFCCFCAEEEAA